MASPNTKCASVTENHARALEHVRQAHVPSRSTPTVQSRNAMYPGKRNSRCDASFENTPDEVYMKNVPIRAMYLRMESIYWGISIMLRRIASFFFNLSVLWGRNAPREQLKRVSV